MKKIVAMLMALFLVLQITVCYGAEEVLTAPDADKSAISGISLDGGKIHLGNRKDYITFRDVDLTGKKSVSIRATVELRGASNGETLGITLDGPTGSEIIGCVVITESGSDMTFSAAIKETSGVHDITFVQTYGNNLYWEIVIDEIIFSEKEYVNKAKESHVPDSAVKDVYADTWVSTDDFGRAVAEYGEAGDLKTDGREAFMLYWNWIALHNKATTHAAIIPEIVAENPGALSDNSHPGWKSSYVYYWGEPLFGFYDSYDYWVYLRHAEMLANAGIDAIFLDYSNGGNNFVDTLSILVEAFREAKANGINVPKISAMTVLGGIVEPAYRNLMSLYDHCFVANDYTDVWYYRDGLPFIFSYGHYKYAIKNAGNDYEKARVTETKDFFSYRYNAHGNRNPEHKESWSWLDPFPQIIRNADETGRAESLSVGIAVNHSTAKPGGMGTGVFSDPYSKGRGYTEGFGEDYSENGAREAWFFREQAGLALEVEPKTVMIDGWNEWTALRMENYGGWANAFVDLYDAENSRDFEPSRGVLKDDYYNLLVDFVRKYKGVRPYPVASGMKTIDIAGDVSQWESVGPEFYNNYQDYERNSTGYLNRETNESWVYKTNVNNAISGAKVTFDNENLYFLATATRDITEGEHFMHLYINTDRNKATGWEGYDYAVNVEGKGVISKWNGAWENIGSTEVYVEGNNLQLSVPRGLIAETDTVDMEFKWTDSVAWGDLLSFYYEGSSAPLGRFNYLFTEIAPKTLSETERKALKGTSVLKADSSSMIVEGAKMHVYDADIRIASFEANGTLYVPEEAFIEIMGYGRTKTVYDPYYNILYTYHFEYADDLAGIKDNHWTYQTLGSTEMRLNGVLKTAKAPAIEKDGIVYIPLTLAEDGYGYEVMSIGNGIYTVSRNKADSTAVKAAITHLN